VPAKVTLTITQGSLSGKEFVFDERTTCIIGRSDDCQREAGMTREQGAEMQFPEHDLKDGDEIKLGETVFRVGLYVPLTCPGRPGGSGRECRGQGDRGVRPV
jgi:hypothetical protein